MSRATLFIGLLLIAVVAGTAVVGIGATSPNIANLAAGTASPTAPPPSTPEATAAAPVATAVSTASPTPLPSPSATATPAATAGATPASAGGEEGGLNPREARWQAAVEEHLGDLTGNFGVVVKDLKNGDTYAHNGDQPFATASLYKIWLAAEVLRRGEQGDLDLTKKVTVEGRHLSQSEFDEKLPAGTTVTLERSLWFLITLSSNSAAMLLNDYVDWSEVNALLDDLGLKNSRMAPDRGLTVLGDWRDKSAWATPLDILRFFEMAYAGEIVSPEVSEQIMYLLRNQQIDDRLSVNLPKDVVMAHKTGNLPGVINDVGIIFGPRTDLYVGVMSADADYESATEALQLLGRALYDLEN